MTQRFRGIASGLIALAAIIMSRRQRQLNLPFTRS